MPETAAHYLVKSEPFVYSFEQLCRDGRTRWDGVRNFEARNNLRAMKAGDRLLFYHSNEGKQIVGVAEVIGTAYPDPTAPGEDWSVVDMAPVAELVQPVTLATIKAEPRLFEMALVRKGRISVVPVTAAEYALILKMGGGTKPPSYGPAAPTAKPKVKATAKAKPKAKPKAKAKQAKPAAKPKTKSTAQAVMKGI